MTIEATRMPIRLTDGHRVMGYCYGDGPETLMLANGGPGLPSLYLRAPHARLATRGWRVITWDQLGCGESDRPDDRSLWTLERYVDEADQVRAAFGADRVHFLGHSWGTWLGTEYALTHPDRVKSYVVADGACDIPHLVSELGRLRLALGGETVTMMTAHEAAGTIDHPEYQAAITLLNHRHVCRLAEWPATLTDALADWNMAPYETMQGPNEFTYTGNMKDWNRVPDMGAIAAPCLVLCGRYDELTPACSMRMHAALPSSRIHIFPHSSHMPFYEETEAYFTVLERFLHDTSSR
ncbi:proline iminopeptidase-family hydrolase [Sphingomonas colocasiae]|uniref:Proline iminopeptidase-family hydrolase n=1 Tax=Sphingomonas colocasiae TaxID=1848973 RepID=A0ABS7PSR5_9SPHN|nr:proline iminopeptidase-family hydrolase [Sphingomonas colocasiae]MBY8824221.1 proline iminopeptidase-family hydrolase [Sphingomonas colocasiae]